jgi:Tfp pilus assembly protein PilO
MKALRSRFDVREMSGAIFLVLGALILANAVVSVVVVRPKVVRYRQLTDLSSPQLQVVKNREKEVVQKETYRASLEKARDDMKHLAGDILSTRQRRMIGVQLETAKLAKECGVALDRIKWENESVDNGALERFATVVPLAGGYTNLRKFIQGVESSDSFLVIESVALGPGKSTDVLELNITLATYFISPEAKLDEFGKKPIVPAKTS